MSAPQCMPRNPTTQTSHSASSQLTLLPVLRLERPGTPTSKSLEIPHSSHPRLSAWDRCQPFSKTPHQLADRFFMFLATVVLSSTAGDLPFTRCPCKVTLVRWPFLRSGVQGGGEGAAKMRTDAEPCSQLGHQCRVTSTTSPRLPGPRFPRV